MAVAGRLAAKGQKFRLPVPRDDSGDSDCGQYSGPDLFQRYSAHPRGIMETGKLSMDMNVENAASQIHPNELRDKRNFCIET